MIVLDRTQANHTINLIARSYTPTGAAIFKVVIKNEQENKQVYSATVTSLTALKYYYTYTANFGLDTAKDQTYLLEVSNTATNSVLYRDKIFGTNQSVSTYSPNTGKFITNTSASNDFLVYE